VSTMPFCAVCKQRAKSMSDFYMVDGTRESDMLIDERYWDCWVCEYCYESLLPEDAGSQQGDGEEQ
jgi:hypothetical protein